MSESTAPLLFASKQDVMANISQIYDSLIDVTEEIDKLHTMLKSVERNQNELILHVSHLRNIISKDLTARGCSPHMLTTTLTNLKMSQNQWQKYINSPLSPNESGGSGGESSRSSSRNNSVNSGNVDKSVTDSNRLINRNNDKMSEIVEKSIKDPIRSSSRNNDRISEITEKSIKDSIRSSSRNNDRIAEIVDKSTVNN